jgi:predicted outer membrane protein
MVMRSDSLMPMMRTDLDSLSRTPSQFAKGMLQAHEAMASQMLDAMGTDMTMMNMRPDSTWTTLTDSVNRDLADLPSLSGRALETRLTAHVGRMRRLLDMHRAMMHK